MTKTITVSDVIPAAAAEIYAAWLDSIAHAAMTGGGKATASPEVGAPYSAWDGYINGLNLALNPGERIEQTWRSTDFNSGDPDSTLTVLLEPADQGTKVTLVHSGVPDQLADFADGWRQYYFEPMKSYFAALMAPVAAATAPEPAASEPASPKKPAVRKATAAKKQAAAKPASGKKSAGGKKAATRTAAKKPAAKAGSVAKKTVSRTATAKKGTKKAAAKKTAAKKPAARKSSARKTPKKAAPRKAVARKPAPRKPGRRGATTTRKGRR